MQCSSSGQLTESSRTLWAGSLPPFVDESILHSLFAQTGELVSTRVMRDRQTGLSQGFAFLEFSSHAAAQAVLNMYDGKPILPTNHVLRLNWAAFGLGRSLEGSEGTESHSLFVGDLALEVTDLLLQKHFQQFFPSVNSAKVITERSTGRSKGYGFVRFASAAERNKALGCMGGHIIGNRPIRVSHAAAKKYQGDGLFHPSDLDPSNTTAFVGNVTEGVTEADLNQVFRRCGEIASIKLLRAKGCAFVTYAERASAERAIVELHGKVIKNCAIRLCWGRRSSQPRGQLPEVGAHMGLPLMAPDYRSDLFGGPPGGALPSMAPMPQSSVVNAALQAASASDLRGIPSYQAGLPGIAAGQARMLRMVPPDMHSVPDALQALANLSLSQGAMSAPGY